jgi:type II secretory pathway pseudopilin PulG
MISPKAQLLFFQLQSRRQKTSEGFSMIEVLVGILMILSFTLISAQSMVTATAIRVRAQEKSETSNWIQQNLESVKIVANQINYDSASRVYPISSAIADHAARCTAASSGAGYAQALKTMLDTETTQSLSSGIGSRPYTLTRTTAVDTTAPFNVLEVTYNVYRGTTTTGEPISTLYTEVVPGASLACRQTAGS